MGLHSKREVARDMDAHTECRTVIIKRKVVIHGIWQTALKGVFNKMIINFNIHFKFLRR